MTIDFSWAEEQKILQDTAREFLERHCPTDVVRALEESERGYSREIWEKMGGLGWIAIDWPTQYGGSGGSFLDVYALYEIFGRFLLPSPHLETAEIAGRVILESGSPSQRDELLPAIASGDLVITPAILEPEGTFGAEGIRMSAEPSVDGFVLNGTKLLVAYAGSADRILCVARTSGDREADGISLFLVDPSSTGVTVEPLDNMAGVKQFSVSFSDVRVEVGELLGEPGRGWDHLAPALMRGAILQVASISGAGQRVLEMTTQHAIHREQFGQPIGKFQAVQYLTSDILIDLHRADLLGKQAAFLLHAERPHAREAAIAVAFAKKAAAHMHRQAHEVHAGLAFILEHDLTLYSRRAKHWENNLGDARYHQEQLAVAMRL